MTAHTGAADEPGYVSSTAGAGARGMGNILDAIIQEDAVGHIQSLQWETLRGAGAVRSVATFVLTDGLCSFQQMRSDVESLRSFNDYSQRRFFELRDCFAGRTKMLVQVKELLGVVFSQIRLRHTSAGFFFSLSFYSSYNCAPPVQHTEGQAEASWRAATVTG